ncbi:MAG: DUF2147 domain-containing protein [Pseudomonadota bacterium]
MRLAVFAAAGVLLTLQTAMANDVLGVWKSQINDEGNYLHVEMAPCAADAKLVCGTIIKAENVDPAKGDKKRQAELMGKVMINDMAADGANEWGDGTIWAPDDEETYSSTLELKGDVLEVSGCVFGGLICRGQDWTRVK